MASISPRGAILTKSVKYTHELAHWVNAVRDPERNPKDVVSRKLKLIGDWIVH